MLVIRAAAGSAEVLRIPKALGFFIYMISEIFIVSDIILL